MCNDIYSPVCGFSEKGYKFDFGNRCGACADTNIVYVLEGQCVSFTGGEDYFEVKYEDFVDFIGK